MKKTIPAVSIIIPMYNTEKYIGECLDSILAQTFTDYEVIVVDDCSTDKSCEVVESYLPKFNGKEVDKLQLIRSKKNSGGLSGEPRNTGIRFSVGEYLFFMDSDDVIVENALEEFNRLIKKFDVEVLYCTKYYVNTAEFSLKDKLGLKVASTDEINEPVLMSNNLKERLDKFCEKKYISFSWNQFFKRAFIAKNNIKFPPLRCGTDYFFGLYALCLAKNILCVPNLWYVWRQTNKDSITKAALSADKMLHRWVDSLFKGINIIDTLIYKIKFFSEHPEYKHRLYELLIYYHTHRVANLYAQIPAYQLDGLIRRELDEVEDKTALTAFLFARMNVLNVQLNRQAAVLHNLNVLVQHLQAELNKLKN